MPTALTLVTLFSVATGVAIVTRYLKVPYTVALVVIGLALGPTHLLHPPQLTQELLYSFFLPGLLFEAAYHLELGELWRSKLRLFSLALPGVIASMLATAALLVAASRAGLAEPLALGGALVFASIVAATDPIAVVALFKELGAPRGLRVLIEGESLLNDGTAIVLYTAALAMVGNGGLSAWGAVAFFVRVVALGIALGAALGWIAALVMRRVEDPMIAIAATTIAAYGSFAWAERIGGSGVLATVTAGLLCGSVASARMGLESKKTITSFWDYVAFAFNSIVFLLVGFIVDAPALLRLWRPISVAYLVIVLTRGAMVFLVALALHRTREHVPWTWSAILTWGGLRGALSMVLALALPADFPHRATIVTMTFGVVVLSLLVQGLTISGALRRLGLVAASVDDRGR